MRCLCPSQPSLSHARSATPRFSLLLRRSFIDTPHIDSLAAEGLRYDCAYSTSPVCVAARHNLLRGSILFARACWATGSFCVLTTRPAACYMARAHTRRLPQRRHRQDALLPWDASMGFDDRVICEDKRWLHIQDDYADYLAERGCTSCTAMNTTAI